MTPWDKGRKAAREGKSKRANPYNHPDRQAVGSAWERWASEWDEGFSGYDAEQEAQERSERAKMAAQARWAKARKAGTAHGPAENRKTYVKITYADGEWCICLPGDLAAMTTGAHKFTTEEVQMTEAEFNALPEFQG